MTSQPIPEFRVSALPGLAPQAHLVPPGYRAFARGGWLVTCARYPETVINGVPVVATPAEIDIASADQLRAVLLHATRNRQPVVVVDMTSTGFCDVAGTRALIAAYKRAYAEGTELRLVIPAGGAVPRIVTLTGTDRIVPCFTHPEEAVAKPPP